MPRLIPSVSTYYPNIHIRFAFETMDAAAGGTVFQRLVGEKDEWVREVERADDEEEEDEEEGEEGAGVVARRAEARGDERWAAGEGLDRSFSAERDKG